MLKHTLFLYILTVKIPMLIACLCKKRLFLTGSLYF
jgi:hypothetical protein